ncbi:MAG TPA: 16S rRNA (guanine(527)-N(7))-methyltransferase RsmG [Terricaulis sp.]|nr:16S rRNA (guanine(527)-N(7))-methyltransferase RsmG [Terricaulis sp.]HRP11951.1 16S rRNA (guanine(527)-N(7))-methyltransferase RsmG [Terricaulis sp.]
MSYGPDEFQRDLGFPVSRETIARMATHLRLLGEWSERMNLVGPREIEAFWQRHALDSAQLVALAPEAKSWVDLGSGAGFPGLVIAAFLAERPGADIHLVESTGKKAAFLRAVAEEAGLPVTVFNERIEAFGAGRGAYEVVTARALAPLPRLMAYAKPILDRGAIGLFHKGADLDAELAAANDALKGGAFRADVLESLSDPRGRILRITKAA